MSNDARKAYCDSLTLAERIMYDQAYGRYWFNRGHYPAAAHQFAKNRVTELKVKERTCRCHAATTTANPPPVTPTLPHTQAAP